MTNSIKAVAATLAAPKVLKPRAEFVDMATRLHDVATTLSALVYEAAMLCREHQATKEESDLLVSEIPKQRRAEFRRIVAAPQEHMHKSAPTNLTKLAKYLTARAGEKTHTEAKAVAEGKAELAPKVPAKREVKTPVGTGSLNQLVAAVEAARIEYADSAEVLAMISELSDMVADLVDKTANA